jgi:hypothetical protein
MALRRTVGNPNQNFGLPIVDHSETTTSRLEQFEAVDQAARNAV